jgi:hypothetical protein
MGKKIYGVDLSQNITPVIVKDAIIRCFLAAHKDVLEDLKKYGSMDSEEELEKMKKLDVELLIQKYFKETGGDFDNPSKDELVAVCDKLAEYASHFRKPDVIKKHYNEIIELVRCIN